MTMSQILRSVSDMKRSHVKSGSLVIEVDIYGDADQDGDADEDDDDGADKDDDLTRVGHAYAEYANDADYAHMRNMRMRMRIENLIHIIHI